MARASGPSHNETANIIAAAQPNGSSDKPETDTSADGVLFVMKGEIAVPIARGVQVMEHGLYVLDGQAGYR